MLYVRELARSFEGLGRKRKVFLKEEQNRGKMMVQTLQKRRATRGSTTMLAQYQLAWDIKQKQQLLLHFPLAKPAPNTEKDSILIT